MVLFYEAVRVARALLQVVVGGFAQLRARLPRACKEVVYAELVKQGLRCVFSQEHRALWFERVAHASRGPVRYVGVISQRLDLTQS